MYTTDLHNMMFRYSVDHLDCLTVLGQCQLNCDSLSSPRVPRFRADAMQIATSLTKNSLLTLIAQLDVETL